MATKNQRVTPVTPVNKAVVKKATEVEYYTRNIHDDEDDDWEGGTFIFGARKGSSNFEFTVSSDQDPFCCGMDALGGFGIQRNSNTITNKDKVEAIRRGMEKVINSVKKGNREITLQFTLIDSPSCNLMAQAVADGKLFTKVKTFTNSNSGRVNDLYVSN